MTADDVKNVIIWGNHSSTQYPDVNHAKVKLQGKEVGVYEAIKDDNWLKGEFITVRRTEPPEQSVRGRQTTLLS